MPKVTDVTCSDILFIVLEVYMLQTSNFPSRRAVKLKLLSVFYMLLRLRIVQSSFLNMNNPESQVKTGEITLKPHNGMKIWNMKVHNR